MPSRQERFNKAAKDRKKQRQWKTNNRAGQIEYSRYMIETLQTPAAREALIEEGKDPDRMLAEIQSKLTQLLSQKDTP